MRPATSGTSDRARQRATILGLKSLTNVLFMFRPSRGCRDGARRTAIRKCLDEIVAERRDALLIGQHADRPRPVGAPHATIQPERIDDPQYRLPDIVVWERLVRHRAGTADLHPYVLVLARSSSRSGRYRVFLLYQK